MYTHSFPMRPARALAPSRFAAGVLVTLALLSAACSDSGSRITSPPLRSSPSNVTSVSSSVTSSGFAVLANTAVTCTSSTINGDVGINSAVGVFTPVTFCNVGTVDIGGATAIAAYNAFVAAYGTLAALSCDFFLAGTLAGVTLTVPGVYCFTSYAALTGTLTLDGPSGGQWIFKIGTSGTGYLAPTNFSVVMAGATQPCNVTWWVNEYAELTTSAFQGNILAGTYVTMTSSTSNGNAWSQTAVTLTGTTLTGCANVPTSGGGGGFPTLAGGTDHFACYETTDKIANAKIPITLDDQFAGVLAGNAQAALYLCNPVAKTVGAATTPIDEPNGHLIFYQLTQNQPTIKRTVVINNQFGQQTLKISTAAIVAVPTLKNGVGTPTDDLILLSHFACYVVSNGPSLNLRVGLQDQFFETPQAIVVKVPQWFCQPAVKTHGAITTTILADEDHLVCYNVANSVNPPKLWSTVTVENQFEGFSETNGGNLSTPAVFNIGPLHFLCVPSEKVSYTPA